jgi:hypothetical protein
MTLFTLRLHMPTFKKQLEILKGVAHGKLHPSESERIELVPLARQMSSLCYLMEHSDGQCVFVEMTNDEAEAMRNPTP